MLPDDDPVDRTVAELATWLGLIAPVNAVAPVSQAVDTFVPYSNCSDSLAVACWLNVTPQILIGVLATPVMRLTVAAEAAVSIGTDSLGRVTHGSTTGVWVISFV